MSLCDKELVSPTTDRRAQRHCFAANQIHERFILWCALFLHYLQTGFKAFRFVRNVIHTHFDNIPNGL